MYDKVKFLKHIYDSFNQIRGLLIRLTSSSDIIRRELILSVVRSGKDQKLIHGPLIIGVGAVLAGQHPPIWRNQEFGWQAESAARRVHARDVLLLVKDPVQTAQDSAQKSASGHGFGGSDGRANAGRRPTGMSSVRPLEVRLIRWRVTGNPEVNYTFRITDNPARKGEAEPHPG